MMLYEKPVKLELTERKLFADGKEIIPSIRDFLELSDVLMGDIEKTGDAYYMFRNIAEKNSIRYDVTLIPQWDLDTEYAKTYGHCHPIAEEKLSYPEIYQVLAGEAKFVLQKELADGSFLVSIVEAKKGDVVLMPPNHCHVSINPVKEDLLLANLVSTSFNSDYSLFKTNHGAAYYYTKEKGFVQNSHYLVYENEKINSKELNKRYNIKCADLLSEFYEDPGKFEFLKKPSLLEIDPSYL